MSINFQIEKNSSWNYVGSYPASRKCVSAVERLYEFQLSPPHSHHVSNSHLRNQTTPNIHWENMNMFLFPLPGIDLEHLSIQVERVLYYLKKCHIIGTRVLSGIYEFNGH